MSGSLENLFQASFFNVISHVPFVIFFYSMSASRWLLANSLLSRKVLTTAVSRRMNTNINGTHYVLAGAYEKKKMKKKKPAHGTVSFISPFERDVSARLRAKLRKRKTTPQLLYRWSPYGQSAKVAGYSELDE
jgi:hypothetical protein